MKNPPDPKLPWPIPYEEGVLPIAEMEQGPLGGPALKAYRCPAGIWTCGWGQTAGVSATTQWTKEYADQNLCDDLTHRAALIREACTVEPSPYQLAALVSFAYNYGGWRKSTVLACHNRSDFLAASRAFGLVNQFTNPVTKKKEVSRGLTARRARESALYLKSSEGEPRMPQAVDSQTSVASSPIANTGVVTAAAGGLGVVAQVVESAPDLETTTASLGKAQTVVQQAKSFTVDTLGIPANYFLPIVGIGAGVLVVWWRLKQRHQGWV